MGPESVYQESCVPQRDSSVRKSGTSDLARKRSLQSTDLVLQVLSLLTQSTFRRSRADRFDRIADALDSAFQLIAHDWEVCWECAVVINKEHVSEPFGSVAPDVLGNNFATDRTPNVVHAVLTTYLFCIVEGYGTVPICNDEDMLRWEYFLRSHKRRADDGSSFVLLQVSLMFTHVSYSLLFKVRLLNLHTYAWYEQGRIGRFRSMPSFGQILLIRHGWLLFKENKEWCVSIAGLEISINPGKARVHSHDC